MLGVEDKIWEILMEPMHFYLMIGIFSVLMLLQYMGPVKDFLFSEKWKWLIAPINVVLSSVGIFALKLTGAETIGLKLVIMVLISAVVTLTYEAVAKPLIEALKKRLIKQGG